MSIWDTIFPFICTINLKFSLYTLNSLKARSKYLSCRLRKLFDSTVFLKENRSVVYDGDGDMFTVNCIRPPFMKIITHTQDNPFTTYLIRARFLGRVLLNYTGIIHGHPLFYHTILPIYTTNSFNTYYFFVLFCARGERNFCADNVHP